MYIAVICGGLSAERDVSISSGTGAARALRARGPKVALGAVFRGTPAALSDPFTACRIPAAAILAALSQWIRN